MAATTESSSSDMKDQMVNIFFEYSKQFLEAMCEVWPECPSLKQYKLKFDMACVHPPAALALPAKRSLITKYHQAMSPHYARCNSKDESLLMDQAAQASIDLLKDIEFYKKWTPDLHPETKENVWEYINNMNRYGNLHNLYSTVPTGMMGKIEDMANGIATKMSNGEMDMKDLNLNQLGQSVMQSMDHQDLNAFAENMAGNMGDIQSMYSMLGSMMGSMPGGMPPFHPPAAASDEKKTSADNEMDRICCSGAVSDQPPAGAEVAADGAVGEVE